jgi:hypothetical protein
VTLISRNHSRLGKATVLGVIEGTAGEFVCTYFLRRHCGATQSIDLGATIDSNVRGYLGNATLLGQHAILSVVALEGRARDF